MTTKTEHKYAQVLRWIADGEEVQGKITAGSWADLQNFSEEHSTAILKGDPHPFSNYEFRLKPRTITVNGREIVEPERKALEDDQAYWVPSIAREELQSQANWAGDAFDLRCLERGLVHLTKENAIAHAKAMLGID